MALNDPRTGTSLDFHVYPVISNEGTLSDPETILWSSIRHMCSREVAQGIAFGAHGIRRKRDLEAVGRNLKVYIQQAAEFYDAAKTAKPNTAPLLYYYSFLNLAKALCELRHPSFHKRSECYSHGVSWRPNSNYLVDLESERIALTARGVWHVLWEAVSEKTCPAINPTRIRIRDLFLYCQEIGVEVGRAFGRDTLLVDLVEPKLLYDERSKEAWIRFNVPKLILRCFHVSRRTLIDAVNTPRSGYVEVRSTDT